MTITVTTENDTITLTTENSTITLTTKQWSARLSDIVAIALTNGNFIVADGTNWVGKTPAEVGALVGAAAVVYRQYTPVGAGSIPAHSEGLVYYDDDKKSLSYYNDQDDVTLNIGQELFSRVKNVTGGAITNGQVVYAFGSSGDNPAVKLAKADSLTTLYGIAIVTQASISDNSVGYVTVFGRVHDIDTSAWAAGDRIFVDPSTAGDLTNVKPSHPNFSMRVGWVVRSHATEGIVFIDPDREVGNFTDTSVLFANGNGELAEDNAGINFDDATDILTIAGQLRQEGIYAEIFAHDVSALQEIATGASYVKITAFTNNGPGANATPDQANDKITLTETGHYRVEGSISFTSDTNNVEFEGGIFLNGVEQTNVHFARKVGTGADVGNAGFTGIIDVSTAPWDIDFRVKHDYGSAVDITIKYININVTYIGKT